MATVIKFPAPARGKTAKKSTEGNLALDVRTPYAPPARKRGATEEADQRLAELGKIHIARAQLYSTLEGFDEDVYRYTLQERWGVESSGDMNAKQRGELLDYLRDLGFIPTRGRARRGASRKKIPHTLEGEKGGMRRVKLMKQIEAYLAEKGRVEGTHVPWEYATGILIRQTRGAFKHLEQANCKQLQGIIAALRNDARRKGRRER